MTYPRSAVPARALVVDPPWEHDDELPGPGRGGKKVYKNTLTLEQIRAFPLPPLMDDCHLFLWRVGALAEEAYGVARAWGFENTFSELVWVKRTKHGKRHFGMGRTLRWEHETCLIFRRGRPPLRSLSVRSTFEAPLVYKPDGKIWHSAKPDAFYERVEALTFGPYAELFARRHRALPDGRRDPEWACYGNELPP